ncbi:hypothetical protein GCM10028796_50940 [Ramlibacter monticola]|uniref:Uncharacterized protein n=1 Tax=Ramlibacter monticola TaxID=1926872 RepID=A0A937CXN9_9BURK|nr:hypothetical protein [Ramlibacter monticola]MBL0395298.1 hypothetical protein [Ramlibacter monticola]
MKSNFPVIRRGQRVIRMVSELHKMGYQRLRVMPYVHPLAWRLAIAPAHCFDPDPGIVLREEGFRDAAVYSSASGSSYFDWDDVANDDAIQLAEKFVLRFPHLAAEGSGRNWAYTGWLAELLSVLRTGDYLPVIFQSEYMDLAAQDLRSLPLWVHGEHAVSPSERDFVLPPGVDEPRGPESGCELVLSDGGVYVRLLAAVAGFERKHGHWPSRLQATLTRSPPWQRKY